VHWYLFVLITIGFFTSKQQKITKKTDKDQTHYLYKLQKKTMGDHNNNNNH